MLIKATINGPFEVTGPAKIEDAGGQVKELKDGEKAWLCRCGASKNKPFCDGAHAKIGFKADK
ncbi:MAG: CDGSH iron-sulfur domain-containing protein [Patescibacteria group bacterium]